MTQKLIGDILYVFQTTPYQITEDTSDARIIKVQEESYPGFVELNPTLEGKLVKYNYKVICINKQEWMDYINEPDPEPTQKEDPELAWSAESATVIIGADDNVFPTLSNPHNVALIYGSTDPNVASINESTGEITLLQGGECNIGAHFEGDETYKEATTFYALTVQKVIPDLSWSAESATVTIGASDNVFPTLSNPHNLAVQYATFDGTEYNTSDVASIDQSTGEITLLSAGNVTILAGTEEGNVYEQQIVTYTLTVQAGQ